MAKFDKDSFGGTMEIVVAVSLLCSVVVAGAAVGLKSTQNEQKALDKQKKYFAGSRFAFRQQSRCEKIVRGTH